MEMKIANRNAIETHTIESKTVVKGEYLVHIPCEGGIHFPHFFFVPAKI